MMMVTMTTTNMIMTMMTIITMSTMMMTPMRMAMGQVKINGSSEEMLAFAAEMFGDKSTEEVKLSF